MTMTDEGRAKVWEYLDGRLTLFALNDWSLEFGDDPEQVHDAESIDIAGLITELVHDLGTGMINEQGVQTQLARRVGHPTASRHRLA
jgi:hypothetical protein